MLIRWTRVALAATAALAMTAAAVQAAPLLDDLIQEFQNTAPKAVADVRIEAWIERGDDVDQPNEMVITLLPNGKTKLNADPGITVTPKDQPGVEWQVALPHRYQDQTIAYFEPPATVRMPFTTGGDQPIEVLVEYAFCQVDYQCFFGEKTLRVAMTP